MVVFLIPIAVVGYKVWEQRRREEEERRTKQSETPDTAASPCPDETDSDVASCVTTESSLPQSPASAPELASTKASEVATSEQRQHALLRSWKARASEMKAAMMNEQFALEDTDSNQLAFSTATECPLPQSSASSPMSAETVDEALFEQQQHVSLHSWRAHASDMNAALINEHTSCNLQDMLDLTASSNEKEQDASQLPSWQRPSGERSAIVSPMASS